MVGDREKITVSRTLEIIKDKYKNEKDKEAITGEALGDVQDKFPGAITYGERVSKISKDIVILVDDNLNVTAYSEKSEDDGDDDSPTYEISESQYSKKGNYYYYEPDLSGFATDATYYVTYDENGNNETIYGRIDRVEKPTTGWYDYENKIWANVVTVTESNVTYWTWVPRYKYALGTNTADIYFVDINDNCKKIVDGTEETVDTSSYELPESFKFADTKLKGYWVSKYEVQLSEDSGIEQLKASTQGSSIEVSTTAPNGTYTIYLNGVKIAEKQSLNSEYEIKNLKSTKIYDVCVYNETTGRMVGRKKKMVNSIISVDLSGFNPSNTYYVTYDDEGKENIAGRIDKTSAPIGWYDYENKIWANVVTVNESNVTYWTYIPRYEYDTTGAHSTVNLADVKFISKTQTEADYSYTIPESFTFNSEPLAGFWVSKYEVQISEGSGIEQIQLGVTNKDLTVTTSNPSGTYTIYVNGEKTKTGVNLPYKISGLNSNKEYDVCVYSETSGRMIGSKKKSTIANNVIKVDLSGFNPDCTYYVTYDENGKNEQIGNKIKLDSNGNATNMPENWYNYDQKIWANIVTKGQDKDGKELITYWTYIPRSEYDAEGAYNIINFAGIKFIPSTQTEADSGYEIPESFTFGGQNLNGYWVSKYEVQGTID